MKILIPVIGFGKAGGNRVLSELANHWRDGGHHVDFLVDERSPPPYFPTSAGVIRFGAHGRIIDQQNTDVETGFAPSGNALSIYFRMTLALHRVARQYDVVLANHSMTAIPVALANTGRARRFYYVQAYEPEYYEMEAGFKARILAALSRISYRLPLHQVANSPVYLGYRGIRAAQWVPPGLDRAIYYRRKAAPVFKKGKPWTVGVIGRREQPKGTKYVLDAFEKLAAMDPHVCLKVAYGNLPDAWAHDRAEVVYPKDDAELAEFYRSIDVLVAPGTVQLGACHYPVLEAMAVGTPVVTTGYLPASGENSWLVPVKDSDAIVSALIELVGCDEGLVQIKLRNAEVAISDFYWEEVALRFLNIMRSV